MENKWDLLAKEVVNPYWAHGQLEVPEKEKSGYELIIMNFIHSIRYSSTPAYVPDHPSNFPQGLAPRLLASQQFCMKRCNSLCLQGQDIEELEAS